MEIIFAIILVIGLIILAYFVGYRRKVEEVNVCNEQLLKKEKELVTLIHNLESKRDELDNKIFVANQNLMRLEENCKDFEIDRKRTINNRLQEYEDLKLEKIEN